MKINWRHLFSAETVNPDRDWRWLLATWLVATALTLFAGGLAHLFFFTTSVEPQAQEAASSTVRTINRADLEAVLRLINERASQAETLKLTPLNLVDPSL